MGAVEALQPKPGQLPLLGTEGWTRHRAVKGRSKSELIFVFKPPAALATRMHEDAALYMGGQSDRPPHPADMLHISLLALDDPKGTRDETVAKAVAAAVEISARPIPITLDSVGLFGGARHLALYPEKDHGQVAQFAERLAKALKGRNVPHSYKRDSTPHVTLVYGCGRIEPQPITRNYAWIAGEFMLICSHVGETRHEEIGRWQLDPAAPAYAERPRQLQLRI
ncbi:2'-5' RNA ligase family protein [Neorhizobium alkalisoli]|uniref:2'-5' RNA ligase n=1 Tax=Neorhizobium alkalisoli TaxID=528178 RepID=A0A561QRN7_9HYPH|nr:2'-5' RNA ligase family protein [Neorhizobium alkalisoli]TWF52997.1 2'-5' RNA ligase [Neorhizobium alkalisoli]